tara:strand:+ start:1249 stop:1779 length:531 start_codon:yes stop_codon:yes gene_type:complete
MKKLLVLPGNSLRNKEWGEGCALAYVDLFDEVVMQYYDHWDNEENFISLDKELEKIKRTIGNSEDDTWHVFAKSIGSLVTLKAVHDGIVTPKQTVFFGMPLDFAEEFYAGDWDPLSDYKVRTLAFHNDSDPTANYEFTKDKLEILAPSIELFTLRGDNHDYLDFSDYKEKIKEFLS